MKRCTRCGVEKPLTAFQADSRVRPGRSYKRRGVWDDVIVGPDTGTEEKGTRVVSLDAVLDALRDRFADTSNGILCGDFMYAAEFLESVFGAEDPQP